MARSTASGGTTPATSTARAITTAASSTATSSTATSSTATSSTATSTATLIRRARAVLAEAAAAPSPDERFALAHLAALRSAAALFAVRGRPSHRRRLVSAWVLLESIAPELGDWATYFAAGAPARAAVEAGARSAVTARQADDQLRAAEQFLAIVEAAARAGSLHVPSGVPAALPAVALAS